MNSGLFQRLRRIRQNGLMHLIFPSATHTRFEHSLGVVHVADSILQSLIYNSMASRSKLSSENSKGEYRCFDFSCVPIEQLKFIFRVTRLAALVHDLGHGPLSHTFDSFAPKSDKIWELVCSEPYLQPLTKLETLIKDDKHKRIQHEIMSCIFLYKIWNNLGEREWTLPNAIAASILGENAYCLVEDATQKKWISLIHDIISSAPADADRMDYLERDSKSCGVTYGLFDRDRLLKTMLCYAAPGNQYRLGLKLSGLRAAENFVQARFELFVQVYYHKTNRAIELMLNKVSRLATAIDIQAVQTGNLSELENDYIRLGDDSFLDWLKGERPDFVSKPTDDVIQIAKLIHARRLWKRIFDIDFCVRHTEPERESDKTARAEHVKSELSKRYIASAPYLQVDTVPPRATKDLDKGAKLLRRGADGIYAAQPHLTWRDASPIIKALEDEEKSIIRVFFCADDPTVAKKLREAAFQIDVAS